MTPYTPPLPEALRPPCHYVLAEEIGIDDQDRLDARVVVACNHEVQSHHWFTRALETVTCVGCRERLWRPHARAYHFVDGEIVES